MKPLNQLLTILIIYLRTNLVGLTFLRKYQEKVRRERQSCAVQRAELNERSGEVPQWQSEARYQSLVKAVAQVVWNTNAQGQVVNDLPSWRLLTGQSWEEIQGWGWLNAIHPQERAETARRWTQAVATKGIYEIEHRVRLVDGSYGFFLARGVPVFDLEGKILEWVGTHTDITAHKQALAQSQTKFQRLVANMPGMVYCYLPCTDGPDRFTFINSGCRELLELEPEIVLQDASSFVKLIHPEDLLSFQESVVTSAQNFLPWRWEGRLITSSGQLKWIQGSSYPERTAEEGDVWDGLLIDITERKQGEAQLRHNALHDVLTGLANRVLFMDRLGQASERAKRSQDYLFAVLFLDLDRFKVINDSLGHTSGDQLLVAFADRLKACIRSGDTVARLGGDEFTVLLEDIQNVEYATQIADRIQKKLKLPFKMGEQEVVTTVSIGIAPSTHGYDQPEDLLRDADIAMYCAKAMGKAQYQLFDKTMHTQAMALLQLETDLRRALEQQEFRLHYQPIVALDSGAIAGFEALVRWQHPLRGLVSPAEFIPVAEETGLSIFIDQWVLREACHQTRQWHELFPKSPPLIISVNLSSLYFRQSQLVEHINQTLQETRLAAHSLKLEIMENMIMTDEEFATAKLLQLKALGIQLCIDDFGTGYSSLSRLHSFPIDVLKIDRSFVSCMSSNKGNLQLVETIVTLAQKLDMDVIAEGIETAEQLAQLREIKCGYGQGYFFSRGLDSNAAEALLLTKPQW